MKVRFILQLTKVWIQETIILGDGAWGACSYPIGGTCWLRRNLSGWHGHLLYPISKKGPPCVIKISLPHLEVSHSHIPIRLHWGWLDGVYSHFLADWFNVQRVDLHAHLACPGAPTTGLCPRGKLINVSCVLERNCWLICLQSKNV